MAIARRKMAVTFWAQLLPHFTALSRVNNAKKASRNPIDA
jgi:hypothetical protein